jgi:two-component system, response regulator PdtaR
MKILLIEDEFILAEDLSNTLESEGYEVVSVIDNGAEALDFYKENEIDLVLCDINIKGEWDGIETVEKLIKVKACPIIYLTALTDFETLERAKKTFPAAYIPKPYHITNLRMAIELAINNFAIQVNKAEIRIGNHLTESKEKINQNKEQILQVNDDIFIKQNYQFVKFPLSDILYLEADNIHTNIITSHKKYVIRQTITNILERFSMKNLVQIHRSYVVNINKIDSFNEHEVTINNTPIPISRSHKDDFLRQFMFR